jgi:beta-glucosidase
MKHIRKPLIGAVIFIFITGISYTAQSQQIKELPQLGTAPIKEVIAAMTLEEKASLVVGGGLNIPMGMRKNKMFAQMVAQPGTLAGKTINPVPSTAGNTVAIPRLGIPCVVVNDGPAGLRMMGGFGGQKYECTAFPIGTLLASSWDTALIFQTGMAYGNDVLEYGVDILLAPGMNIQRNPLCGRNFEYYSEDPILSGRIAAAMVNGIQSQGVGVSIKHFVANNQETDRQSVNTIVSERALREIYLKGFRIAAEQSNPWTVMSSYNLLNGYYTSENHDLLTGVLRGDWGYKGMVMSDWGAGKDAVAQMKAGNDLLMPGPNQVDTIIQAVRDGKLEEKILDRNVENILNLIVKTPRFKKYKYSNKPATVANAAMSRKAATEGMILLKNSGHALPFTGKIKNIALFGNTSYQAYIGGAGSGFVAVAYSINLLDGLINAGYSVDDALKDKYINYMKQNAPTGGDMIANMMGGKKRAAEMEVTDSTARKMADKFDIAIYTIGRNSGEGEDRKLEDDYNLSSTELSSINNISNAFHHLGKKIVVVLNIGGVIETASWRNIPDAILLAWQPGLEAGNAITDIITGKVNPSGKLAQTFPISYADVPSAKNFPGVVIKNDSVVKRQVVYEEGIYVGYRYYHTFGIKTAYEFGFGLSYTNFEYSNLSLDETSFQSKIEVSVTIKNTGEVAGKEVVQLYLSAPQKVLGKPFEELKGFAKTKLLMPGESQILKFTLFPNDLSSFETDKSAWVAAAGKYDIKIGASSENIKLAKSFALPKELVVEKVGNYLAPQLSINELKKTVSKKL